MADKIPHIFQHNVETGNTDNFSVQPDRNGAGYTNFTVESILLDTGEVQISGFNRTFEPGTLRNWERNQIAVRVVFVQSLPVYSQMCAVCQPNITGRDLVGIGLHGNHGAAHVTDSSEIFRLCVIYTLITQHHGRDGSVKCGIGKRR